MVFHMGAVWRLNEAGFRPRLDRISSLSDGSIAAGVLGSSWSRQDFDAAGRARNLEEEFVTPARATAGRTIDRGAVLGGLLPWNSPGDRIAGAYRKHLLGKRTFQDPPDRPRFVITSRISAICSLTAVNHQASCDGCVCCLGGPERLAPGRNEELQVRAGALVNRPRLANGSFL